MSCLSSGQPPIHPCYRYCQDWTRHCSILDTAHYKIMSRELAVFQLHLCSGGTLLLVSAMLDFMFPCRLDFHYLINWWMEGGWVRIRNFKIFDFRIMPNFKTCKVEIFSQFLKHPSTYNIFSILQLLLPRSLKLFPPFNRRFFFINTTRILREGCENTFLLPKLSDPDDRNPNYRKKRITPQNNVS